MAQIILDSNNNLIQGDFDNATVNNRTKFKTTTTDATTNVYAVPNGSATSAGFSVSNAADPTNASKITIATNGSTDTQIISGINGTGSYLPMSFYTNNALAAQLTTAGNLSVTGTVAAATGTLYPIVSGTSQASTSGTSITFTGIPSWAKRVSVLFNGISSNGSSVRGVRLGSGSTQSTGYDGAINWFSTLSAGSSNGQTTMFPLPGTSAADVINGIMVIALQTGNTWISSFSGGMLSTTYFGCSGGGNVTLSGALDRIVITTVNGTDAFDAGSINILYE